MPRGREVDPSEIAPDPQVASAVEHEPDTYWGGFKKSLGETVSGYGRGLKASIPSMLHSILNIGHWTPEEWAAQEKARAEDAHRSHTFAGMGRTIQRGAQDSLTALKSLSDPETGGNATGQLLAMLATGRAPEITGGIGKGIELGAEGTRAGANLTGRGLAKVGSVSENLGTKVLEHKMAPAAVPAMAVAAVHNPVAAATGVAVPFAMKYGGAGLRRVGSALAGLTEAAEERSGTRPYGIRRATQTPAQRNYAPSATDIESFGAGQTDRYGTGQGFTGNVRAPYEPIAPEVPPAPPEPPPLSPPAAPPEPPLATPPTATEWVTPEIRRSGRLRPELDASMEGLRQAAATETPTAPTGPRAGVTTEPTSPYDWNGTYRQAYNPGLSETAEGYPYSRLNLNPEAETQAMRDWAPGPRRSSRAEEMPPPQVLPEEPPAPPPTPPVAPEVTPEGPSPFPPEPSASAAWNPAEPHAATTLEGYPYSRYAPEIEPRAVTDWAPGPRRQVPSLTGLDEAAQAVPPEPPPPPPEAPPTVAAAPPEPTPPPTPPVAAAAPEPLSPEGYPFSRYAPETEPQVVKDWEPGPRRTPLAPPPAAAAEPSPSLQWNEELGRFVPPEEMPVSVKGLQQAPIEVPEPAIAAPPAPEPPASAALAAPAAEVAPAPVEAVAPTGNVSGLRNILKEQKAAKKAGKTAGKAAAAPPVPAEPAPAPAEPATPGSVSGLRAAAEPEPAAAAGEPVEIAKDIVPTKSRREMSATPGLSVSDLEGLGLDPTVVHTHLTPDQVQQLYTNRAQRSAGYRSGASTKKSVDRIFDTERAKEEAAAQRAADTRVKQVMEIESKTRIEGLWQRLMRAPEQEMEAIARQLSPDEAFQFLDRLTYAPGGDSNLSTPAGQALMERVRQNTAAIGGSVRPQKDVPRPVARPKTAAKTETKPSLARKQIERREAATTPETPSVQGLKQSSGIAEQIAAQRAKAAERDTVTAKPRSTSVPSSSAILNAMHQIDSQTPRGVLINMEKLRAQLADRFPDKAAFDKAVVDLANKGVVQLQSHAWPGTLTDAEKLLLIPNGKGGWFDSIGLRTY